MIWQFFLTKIKFCFWLSKLPMIWQKQFAIFFSSKVLFYVKIMILHWHIHFCQCFCPTKTTLWFSFFAYKNKRVTWRYLWTENDYRRDVSKDNSTESWFSFNQIWNGLTECKDLLFLVFILKMPFTHFQMPFTTYLSQI